MNVIRKHHECDCHSEGVVISYDDDMPLVELGFYQYGFGGRVMDFYNRVRCAWHLLLTGTPFNDMVMLDQKTARDLANDLLVFGMRDYSKPEEK